MAIGQLSSRVFNEEFFSDTYHLKLDLFLDDTEYGMLLTVMPRGTGQKEFLEAIKSKFSEEQYKAADKFVPLVLISHGLNAWSNSNLITSISMPWLIDISFILAESGAKTIDQKKETIINISKLWENFLNRYPTQTEIVDGFIKLSKNQCLAANK